MDKYNSIFVDGIDRSGKNTVVKYIHNLANHRYMAYDRGIFSNITYDRMFNRNVEYDINQYKPFVFVYLYCDKEDWNIRCKLTNEPKIDYADHLNAFDITYDQFKNNGFKIITFNTSYAAPYQIALEVINYVNVLNEQEKGI